MKKVFFVGPMVATVGLCLFTLFSCNNDDGCTTSTFYLDKDLDGYGAGAPTTACKAPTATVGQYVLVGGDADDNNANINPGCDLVFYLDADGDGFGVDLPLTFCEEPEEGSYTDNDTAFDCDDTNPAINPDVLITYYPDNDGDGFGDPNGQTTAAAACAPIPDGFVANNQDCDDTSAILNPGAGQITFYGDGDDDGYGSDEEFVIRDACDPPMFNYVLQGGDCNDNDPSINPEAEENPNDGIDSNCDGEMEAIIWTGPDFQFTKVANADWAGDVGAQDELTDNITLTRSTDGFITNIKWWSDAVEVVPTENGDLPWEYYGPDEHTPDAAVGSAPPSGGPYGVRWAILEQGADTPAWDNFDWYGELGDPTHFYSLNNIVTICWLLNNNMSPTNIVDDFGIDNTSDIPQEAVDYSAGNTVRELELITLGVWLVEENIYFKLTFTNISNVNFGNGMTYTRSTPNN